MAMELNVLSQRRLASIADWQRAIDLEGYPLRLSPDVAFESVAGFVPARLDGKQSGFECYHDDPARVMKAGSDADFGRSWAFALGLRIIGDFAELRAAWMAATAYARATGGVVHDPEEERLYDYEGAREAVRAIERDWPVMEAAVQAAVRIIATKS
jgi:hypothetical protein